MDFDSPDVEHDFPGLYASESADGKSRKSKEDSDYSDGDHDKISKKELLIGRRKDKKEKSKDRGYAALEGESSPEEELDAKSPTKTSKKSKAFKFTTSKSKDKREKSRDKEKSERDGKDEKLKDKALEKDKLAEKERDQKKKYKEERKDKKDKCKDKDKDKEKDKDRDKDKERKDKKDKLKSSTSMSTEEALELGSPVFGVSVSLATDRSRCHDGIDIPLVVRDCIDYLQEYALKNDQIYRVEPLKTRLLHFKRLYNNRERQPDTDELDVPTACGLIKLFFRELPEPILTTDLISQFEEVASNADALKSLEKFKQLFQMLPACNKTLLSWLLLHFHSIVQHEKHNKMNAQSLAMLLSPPLQMSHRLLVVLVVHSSTLFSDVKLVKYIPPLTSSSPKLPETQEGIQIELCKQESLLNQIHAEMNAGFVSKKREEQLWEVQRIITQLKRKLRTMEKKQEKSLEVGDANNVNPNNVNNGSGNSLVLRKSQTISDEEAVQNPNINKVIKNNNSGQFDEIKSKQNQSTQNPPVCNDETFSSSSSNNCVYAENVRMDETTGLLMLPKNHPDYTALLRLQLHNRELIAWKTKLQNSISSERAEVLRLKQVYQQLAFQANANDTTSATAAADGTNSSDYERLIEHYVKENALLEHKKQMLSTEIFKETSNCITLQVELALRQL